MTDMMNYQQSSSVPQSNSVTTELVITRQAQEIQAAMIVAKRFPRNDSDSYARIMRSCERKGLAARAMYEYPRGSELVTGPSIRLAEAMAQAWGNLDFGITELEQRAGESTVMAYCWDLETNTRQTKIFTVPHIRQTKKGAKVLTDPRDIYEMVANQGARRLRACILGILPGDIVDDALIQCQRTIAKGDGTPLADRVRNMVYYFQKEFGVPRECLEQYIGCKVEAFTEQSVIRLRNVCNAIKDGRADREQYFTLPAVAAPESPVEPSLSKSDTQPRPEVKTQTQGTEMGKADVKQVSMDDL